MNLTILLADDLAAVDKNDTSDPYVIAYVIPKDPPSLENLLKEKTILRYKTDVQRNTLNPRWNEEARFPICTLSDHAILFRVFDSNRIRKDRYLGEASITLTRAFSLSKKEYKLCLKDPSAPKRNMGTIHIATEFSEITDTNPRYKKVTAGGALQIRVDKTQLQSGDTVKGTVLLNFRQDGEKVKRIFVALEMSERNHWFDEHSGRDNLTSYEAEHIVSQQKTDLEILEQIVTKKVAGKFIEYRKGNAQWQFQFTIPNELFRKGPGWDRYNTLDYSINAKVVQKGVLKNKSCKVPLSIQTSYDLWLSSLPKEELFPLVAAKHTMKDGIEVSLHANKTHGIIGEDVDITFSITNTSKNRLEGYVVSFHRTRWFYGKRSDGSDGKQYNQTIETLKRHECEKGSGITDHRETLHWTVPKSLTASCVKGMSSVSKDDDLFVISWWFKKSTAETVIDELFFPKAYLYDETPSFSLPFPLYSQVEKNES
eukprot:TRINITY_DN1714_c0_g2_i1.p1 TRINITY_DN1714_c0_g2~~TRINITY_DN1714_c0_g2_i1.p1  ORF type:complete len:527 (-),score=84.76 TRINITY_DN1714_c0_g2_i1:49-1497(-)